jgi:hypothetical protein
VSTPSAASDQSGGAPPDRLALLARTNDIEEAYEYFLAYAAQGLPADAGGAAIRGYLDKFDAALNGLGVFFTAYVAALKLEAADYADFIAVIDRDAHAARAAVKIVLAQPAIGSQIIDNLNANIHVRALLTDLFLIDEVLKPHAGE